MTSSQQFTSKQKSWKTWSQVLRHDLNWRLGYSNLDLPPRKLSQDQDDITFNTRTFPYPGSCPLKLQNRTLRNDFFPKISTRPTFKSTNVPGTKIALLFLYKPRIFSGILRGGIALQRPGGFTHLGLRRCGVRGRSDLELRRRPRFWTFFFGFSKGKDDPPQEIWISEICLTSQMTSYSFFVRSTKHIHQILESKS